MLIDLEAHVGRTRTAVGYDALMRILEADGVAIEPGDMVCLHTGFGDTLMSMNRQPDVAHLHATGSGLDGDDARLLRWIVDARLACLIADNPAVELVRPVALGGGRPRRCAARACRCMSTACSRTASTWVNCGG